MEIEFVKYDGGYPALCCGTLTLRIDGGLKTFGSGDCDYRDFWRSGGICGFTDEWRRGCVERHPWKLCEWRLPKGLQGHAQELIDLFNEHVPYGCCGGCA